MKKNITFTLPAEAVQGASEVKLLGDFNNWNAEIAPKLEKKEDGSFYTIEKLEAGQTYQYRFLLNDGRWVNDYNAQNYAKVPGYYVDNCVITIPEQAKENKTEKTVVKKATKAASAEGEEPVAAKSSKKADSKVKSSEPKAAKSKAKSDDGKASKPAKAVKKATPKTSE